MIQFSILETGFNLRNKLKIKEWVKLIISKESKMPGDLTFIFCSDEYLLKLNQQYLGHETLTDILTFDYCTSTRISGDIFISLDRVKENAIAYSNSMDEEIGRVMAHGTLHLLGYRDKSKSEKMIMKAKENQYLVSFPNLISPLNS